MADAHLHVRVWSSATPIRPEAQDEISGLKDAAFAEPFAHAGARCFDDAQTETPAFRMFEIDQDIGCRDLIGDGSTRAARQSEEGRDAELFGQPRVGFLALGEPLQRRLCRGGRAPEQHGGRHHREPRHRKHLTQHITLTANHSHLKATSR
jgi:hypothetical protein